MLCEICQRVIKKRNRASSNAEISKCLFAFFKTSVLLIATISPANRKTITSLIILGFFARSLCLFDWCSEEKENSPRNARRKDVIVFFYLFTVFPKKNKSLPTTILTIVELKYFRSNQEEHHPEPQKYRYFTICLTIQRTWQIVCKKNWLIRKRTELIKFKRKMEINHKNTKKLHIIIIQVQIWYESTFYSKF